MGARESMKATRQALRKPRLPVDIKRELDRMALEDVAINKFCNKWGAVALELAQRLDVEGVPPADDRWQIKVDGSDLVELRLAGCKYERIYGLRIVT